jgi:ABC-type multidrug transport system permease subunit
VTTRASIIIWSAGSGVLLGLFVDAAILGIWLVVSSVVPAMVPRQLPRWFAALAVLGLAVVLIAAGILGYLEGRLKID